MLLGRITPKGNQFLQHRHSHQTANLSILPPLSALEWHSTHYSLWMNQTFKPFHSPGWSCITAWSWWGREGDRGQAVSQCFSGSSGGFWIRVNQTQLLQSNCKCVLTTKKEKTHILETIHFIILTDWHMQRVFFFFLASILSCRHSQHFCHSTQTSAFLSAYFSHCMYSI